MDSDEYLKQECLKLQADTIEKLESLAESVKKFDVDTMPDGVQAHLHAMLKNFDEGLAVFDTTFELLVMVGTLRANR